MIYVALENIRSLYNIGAIFRTLSFFGIYDVILVGYSGKDSKGNLHKDIVKTSLGSENDLNITFLETSSSLLAFAKENKLKIVSVEQNEKSTDLKDYGDFNNCVLVFGNEVAGITQEVLEISDAIVEIQRTGKHKSLNVTTAVGIALHTITCALCVAYPNQQ